MNYRVFVKQNEAGVITAVCSDAFLVDTTGWAQIDAGEGDRFHHAQGNYFEDGLYDKTTGLPNYQLESGAVVRRNAQELVPPGDGQAQQPKEALA